MAHFVGKYADRKFLGMQVDGIGLLPVEGRGLGRFPLNAGVSLRDLVLALKESDMNPPCG